MRKLPANTFQFSRQFIVHALIVIGLDHLIIRDKSDDKD